MKPIPAERRHGRKEVMLRGVRVLIFHGYLLSGTGSNVYNASLARAMRALGHEVHLICQERAADRLGFVDAVGDWDTGELAVKPTGAPGASGSLTVYTPDIGGLLPVYVRDRYEGFQVKEFPELSDAELAAYIERNVTATRQVVARAGGVEVALANHLVMAPVVLDRAGLGFAIKVHGSDLSYTVLPNLDRFGPYAAAGARAANGILVGSGHIAQRLRQAIDEPGVNAKVKLGPPGVDAELFKPLDAGEAAPRLRDLAAALATADAGEGSRGGSWARDRDEASIALRWLAEAGGPRVVFVGKLIVSKGVDLLLAAWPLVHERNPGARLLIAGFGGFRDALEDLWRGLAQGDEDVVRRIAERGRDLEGGDRSPLRHLTAFLADPPDAYAGACARAAGSVAFAGRLEHREVGGLVPATDALVFPSTFPEAFGMVAAEAAAAGVLPVSAGHSGALEVSQALAADLPDEAAG
ncbi:MAG: glycosyltransferase, partial [Actinomycetota bacterium]|nr:glycosyltransferase [Actinomycetota bacterium]